MNENDLNSPSVANQTITSFIGWMGATVSFIWPTTIVGATLKISQAVAIATALSLINITFIQTATAVVCPWMIKTTRERLYATVWFTDQIKKTLGIAVARSFIESAFFTLSDVTAYVIFKNCSKTTINRKSFYKIDWLTDSPFHLK